MKILGFTGTRARVTPHQEAALWSVLKGMWYAGYRQMENGECEGADELAARMAREMGYHIHGRPSSEHEHRITVDSESPARPPLDRDDDIARVSRRLVAVPSGFHEVRRSGTWTTVRRARKYKKIITFVWPDGTMTTETEAKRRLEIITKRETL